MLISYYENRLIVVGQTWSGHKASYIYQLTQKECEVLKAKFDNQEFIKKWVKARAGDFCSVFDYQIEVYDNTIEFQDEDSWSYLEEDVCY